MSIRNDVYGLQRGEALTVEFQAPNGEGFYLTIDTFNEENTWVEVVTTDYTALKQSGFEYFENAAETFLDLFDIFMEESYMIDCFITPKEEEIW